MIRDSNDETNFPHKLLLTDTQILRIGKAFGNNWSPNIKLPKTQLFKKKQLWVLSPIDFTDLNLYGSRFIWF